ncbi:MAG: flagellar hook-associated protein FlgK [Defluviitaleaceae bacterium]|nr:flagellar hook-associated protein FlgK [Defluviitaleaceae bacterium]
MRSSFFEFNVAVSGMNTARNGSRVAVHNMANLTTPGFSRQQVVQRASMPLSTNNRTGMVGTGSEIIGINQIRNPHLDTRFRAENPILGRQETLKMHLTMLEASFGEINGVGINASFDQFFASLQTLHTSPSDPILRNNFINSMTVLTNNINDRATALQRQQSNINQEIGSMVTAINTIGEQLTILNAQIERLEMRGDRANDLRDQRNNLLDELSSFVNIDTTIRNNDGNERLVIHINGHEFVSHDRVNVLEAIRRETKLHPHDVDGLYDIRIGRISINNTTNPNSFVGNSTFEGVQFRTDNAAFSGQLAALFQMRDGDSSRNANGTLVGSNPSFNPHFSGIDFKGIPYYISRLNELVQTISNAFNFGVNSNGTQIAGMTGGHMNGFNHLGEPVNVPLFTLRNFPDGWNDPTHANYVPGGLNQLLQEGVNIFNFTVNPDIVNNHNLLATSTTDEGNGGQSNPDLVLAFMNLRNNPTLFREGNVNDFISSIISELAMGLNEAYRFTESQTDMMLIIQNQRLAVKGVNVDEEMQNMIFFQHHFMAASRMITAINEIYDNMINRMGV